MNKNITPFHKERYCLLIFLQVPRNSVIPRLCSTEPWDSVMRFKESEGYISVNADIIIMQLYDTKYKLFLH